jgi:hypothetical protein
MANRLAEDAIEHRMGVMHYRQQLISPSAAGLTTTVALRSDRFSWAANRFILAAGRQKKPQAAYLPAALILVVVSLNQGTSGKMVIIVKIKIMAA